MVPTSIFDFENYRDYLNACLNHHPRRKRALSIAQWSRFLKLKSPRTLGMVLSGSRNLTIHLAKRLSKDLELDSGANELFELMRQESSFAEHSEERTEIKTRIAHLRRSYSARISLDEEYLSAVDQWFIVAIQQLLPALQEPYRPEEVAKHFRNQFTPADAKRAIDFLQKKRLAKSDEENPRVSSTSDIKNLKIRKFHECMMNQAQYALKNYSSQERNFEGLTLAFDPDRLHEVKQFIRDFVFQFEARFERSGLPHIHQLNIQFFPLTESKL